MDEDYLPSQVPDPWYGWKEEECTGNNPTPTSAGSFPSALLMSLPEFPVGASRVVAGRYPPPGTDIHADAIRERRGARGITPLDANLLHVPPVAGGFNTLLGAIRTKGILPGSLREVMVSD